MLITETVLVLKDNTGNDTVTYNVL